MYGNSFEIDTHVRPHPKFTEDIDKDTCFDLIGASSVCRRLALDLRRLKTHHLKKSNAHRATYEPSGANLKISFKAGTW